MQNSKSFQDVLIRNFEHKSIMYMVGVVSGVEKEGDNFEKGKKNFEELCKALMISYTGGANTIPMIATREVINYALVNAYNQWKDDNVSQCEGEGHQGEAVSG